MFIYFLGRKLSFSKSSVLLAPNIMIGPTIHAIASGVILNPNILRENIPLRGNLIMGQRQLASDILTLRWHSGVACWRIDHCKLFNYQIIRSAIFISLTLCPRGWDVIKMGTIMFFEPASRTDGCTQSKNVGPMKHCRAAFVQKRINDSISILSIAGLLVEVVELQLHQEIPTGTCNP